VYGRVHDRSGLIGSRVGSPMHDECETRAVAADESIAVQVGAKPVGRRLTRLGSPFGPPLPPSGPAKGRVGMPSLSSMTLPEAVRLHVKPITTYEPPISNSPGTRESMIRV
jgi:hypothetical protein